MPKNLHDTLIQPMPTDPDALELKDFANAAAIAADAAGSAPPVTRTVDTTHGLATVHRDANGADVVLHDRDVTVHVRLSGTENER